MDNDIDVDMDLDLGRSMCCIREAEENRRKTELMRIYRANDPVQQRINQHLNNSNSNGMLQKPRLNQMSAATAAANGDVKWLSEHSAQLPKLRTNKIPENKEKELEDGGDESWDNDNTDRYEKQQKQQQKQRTDNVTSMAKAMASSKKRDYEKDSDENESDVDCEEKDKRCKKAGCSRTYPHVHVSSVKKNSIFDDDNDDDGKD